MKRKVISVKPADSIFKVAEILSKHHISGAPVVRKGRVVGVITESDIIKFMKLDLSKSHADLLTEPYALSVVILMLINDQLDVKKQLEKMSKIKVEDFMSTDVISIEPDDGILDASKLLDKYDIDRLLVIKKGSLVGILSRCDLIKSLLD
ncbi:MAG: CBS domain-containing protein [Candidatus Aenigmarchaeota archaeon]|nr:CBS domain-containing protein [Candidatus Aenigmarchaeota archaeon]